ncbi:MAG: hypothetical protein ABIJ23_04380 [Candidatus Magasanikbacteria bacterium]
MILEKLLKIAQAGAEKPLNLWIDENRELIDGIISDLEEIEKELSENTAVLKNVKKLIKLLGDDSPNELELAKALLYVAELFGSDFSTEDASLVQEYIKEVNKFYKKAQLSEFHRQSRQNLKKTLSIEEQKEHDLRLFNHEGMMYCLEYYLALYKAIDEATDERIKRKYIENMEVNLGFGDVPGLWNDFSRDEVLSKFIYNILDDINREKLTKAYFDAKVVVMGIKLYCDKEGNCSVEYGEVSLETLIQAFRELIVEILKTFELVGIKQLSSLFFKPYGNKPFIKDLIKII